MNKSRYTEKEIKFAIDQAEKGVPAKDICAIMGISHATFYAWKYRYGDNGGNEMDRIKAMEEEINMLKEKVARLEREKQSLYQILCKCLFINTQPAALGI